MEAGADVNAAAEDGLRPMHYAFNADEPGGGGGSGQGLRLNPKP
jgi:hypothetical protein